MSDDDTSYLPSMIGNSRAAVSSLTPSSNLSLVCFLFCLFLVFGDFCELTSVRSFLSIQDLSQWGSEMNKHFLPILHSPCSFSYNISVSHKTITLVKAGRVFWKNVLWFSLWCPSTARPRLCDSRRFLKATRRLPTYIPGSVGVLSRYQQRFEVQHRNGHQNQSRVSG